MKLFSFLEKHLFLASAAPFRAADAPPKTMLHRWIRSGQVRINGKRCKPFDRLTAGDRVRIPPFALDARPEADPAATPPPFPTVGEHLSPSLRLVAVWRDILVLEKGRGLASQPGSGQEESVVSILRERFQGCPYIPAPAHRLDKETSGLLLAGRTFAAGRALAEALVGTPGPLSVQKEYYAWVRGVWPLEGEAPLTDMLDGREARCLARPLVRPPFRDRHDAATLLAVTLLTGRTHQIRVQCATRGHPLFGDTRYGGPAAPCLMLHAHRLTLTADGEAPFVVSSRPDWPGFFAVDAE